MKRFIATAIIVSLIGFFCFETMLPHNPTASAAAPGFDKDQTPPNPNRNYFDACGNQYDYQGNLISKGNCADPTPDTEAMLGTSSANVGVEPPSAPGFQGK